MSKIQYTIRNIPEQVDKVIRKRAKQEGNSFNQTVVDMLTLQAFGSTQPEIDEDFGWLFGANTIDPEFDTAIDELSQIDEKLWQ